MMGTARALWALFTLLCAGMTALGGSVGTLALLCVLLLLPLLQLAGGLLCRKNLSLTVECPVSGWQGEPLSVTVAAENGSVLPVWGLSLTVTAENALTGEREAAPLRLTLPPRGRRTMALTLDGQYAGLLRITAARARLYDSFWLLPLPAPAESVGKCALLPRRFPVETQVGADASRLEESEVFSPDKPGADPSETFQLREYVPGDSPRQIHWKLTEKLGRLTVKDFSLPVDRSILLIWERRETRPTPAAEDAQAAVLFSLGQSLLEQAGAFTLLWNEKDSPCCRLAVGDLDDLVGLTPRLLAARPLTLGPTAALALCQTAGEETFAHIIYLGERAPDCLPRLRELGRVTLILSQPEGAPGDVPCYPFDPQHKAQQLREVRI